MARFAQSRLESHPELRLSGLVSWYSIRNEYGKTRSIQRWSDGHHHHYHGSRYTGACRCYDPLAYILASCISDLYLEFSDGRHVLEQPPPFDARNFECQRRGNVDEFASSFLALSYTIYDGVARWPCWRAVAHSGVLRCASFCG